jgi:hypothetical protein
VLQTYRDIADFSGKDVLDSEFSSLTHFCSRQIIRGLKPIDTPATNAEKIHTSQKNISRSITSPQDK